VTGGGQVPLPPRAGPIVDADGHVVEPESAWATLPGPHRPRISADRAGYEHVVIGDTEVLAVPLGTLARPGSSFDDPSSFRPLADASRIVPEGPSVRDGDQLPLAVSGRDCDAVDRGGLVIGTSGGEWH